MKKIKKYEVNATEENLDCTTESYTLFYTISIVDNTNYYNEILINIKNNHIIKIEIDDTPIIDAGIDDLWTILTSNQLMETIKLSKDQGEYCLKLDLNNISSETNIKIYQKRRTGTGTGKLIMSGYVLSYIEEVRN